LPQPEPNDKRPRNAFGFLGGFGRAYAEHYARKEQSMSPTHIKKKYRKRIMAILERIADVLRVAGFRVEGPWDLSSDDYWWSLLAHVDGVKIDVSFKICESEQYDGERGGVNFALDIVEEGGRIIGGLTPFNYTDRCWVSRRDRQAVEERFRILEQADANDIPQLLKEAVSQSNALMSEVKPMSEGQR
jgi:hypothetical protein